VPLAEKLAASEIGADTVQSFSQQPQADQEIGVPIALNIDGEARARRFSGSGRGLYTSVPIPLSALFSTSFAESVCSFTGLYRLV
jgi:hypothetical protein